MGNVSLKVLEFFVQKGYEPCFNQYDVTGQWRIPHKGRRPEGTGSPSPALPHPPYPQLNQGAYTTTTSTAAPPNVTRNVNQHCFKLHRSYCNSFNLSNVGDFFQEFNSEGLYLSSQEEKEIRCHVFPSSIKREIRKLKFHVVASRVVTAKKCTKKA